MLSKLFNIFSSSKSGGSGKVVTRFAPSPTGLLHAGNYRTALFSYLFARQHGGKFILRIEDTDKVRSKKEYEDNVLESLEWLGLKYDEFYRQSDRSKIHASYIQKLIDSGHAYISKEAPKKEGDRDEVIRFRNPKKKVSWNDVIRGKIEFDTTELGDFIIARSMDEPVFHLVVVVDDHEMGVTHLIRGEDHISNTPRHILLHEALGFKIPEYAHLPLLLAPDRSKLSKRKGALPITDYRDKGFLPEALINYMALLGWNPGPELKDREIFSINELVKIFDLAKVQKSGAIFNEEKLTWMNKQYIGKFSNESFVAIAQKFSKNISKKSNPKIVSLIKEKISTFSEIDALFTTGGDLSFMNVNFNSGKLPYQKEALMWKAEQDIAKTKIHLKKALDTLSALSSSDFSSEKVKSAIMPYAETAGKGNVLWPMRYALSGSAKSPDPFTIAAILGKEETIRRLSLAYDAT